MFDKLKSLFSTEYKPYNMVICRNELHKNVCNCRCHINPDIVHIQACCNIQKCPTCKVELRIKKNIK